MSDDKSASNRDLIQWQKDFAAAPCVWLTGTTIDGIWEMSNIYDSKEAAQIEVEWHAKHHRRYSISRMNIHSLELSIRRWDRAFVKDPSDGR